MRKKRKQNSSGADTPVRGGSRERLNAPFARLGDMLDQVRAEDEMDHGGEQTQARADKSSALQSQHTAEYSSEARDCLFREAMDGVERLSCKRVRARVPGPLSKPSRRPLIESELEAYAELVDLVSGEGPFDIQHTDEHMEGMVVGADPGILQKLRQGDYSIQAYLDLHGMTAEEARQALERFIVTSVAKGFRCVLVIHGRGLNSRDQIPILKQHMSRWLKRGRLKRLVLAFSTARPCDGGAGALYVLLRKCLPDC
jgi:DNA-nicking Smr family endonuclease